MIKADHPAGVVLNADNLSNERKLKIAQAVGYSETAFVAEDDHADFEVSFFTVTGEVDYCGHATLAAFSTMYQKGILTEGQYAQKTKAGTLLVTIEPNSHIVMEQKLPEFLGELSNEKVSELIGISSAVLDSTQLPIEIISTGLPDIIVPVPNGYLDKIQVNEDLTRDFCKKHNLIGIHAFELCENNTELTASCRNFAPLVGISEESATGSGSGALACYLNKHLDKAYSHRFTFEQGRAMGCVSRITAAVESNDQGVIKITVGGVAKVFGEQHISV